jgi:sugar lactone lactonase YvrE
MTKPEEDYMNLMTPNAEAPADAVAAGRTASEPRLSQPRTSLFCVCLWLLAAGSPEAVLGQANYATPYTFTTVAGNAGYGSADGMNRAAGFAAPIGAAMDIHGNLYVADFENNTIRKVTPVGTNWVVTTLAGLAGHPGSADGTNSSARFSNPAGVAVDTNGNIYVADWGNNTIREVSMVGTNWVVTTLAGLAGHPGYRNGPGSVAWFNQPNGVAVDSAGNLYVADSENDVIRKMNMVGSGWEVGILAGRVAVAGSSDGTGTSAEFNFPYSVAVDSSNNVYVADFNNDTIRKVTPAGAVTTLAGAAGIAGSTSGMGSSARFNLPAGVAVDSAGNVYVGDDLNDTIRMITPAGVVTTLVGLPGQAGTADGTNSAARFNEPAGVAVDSAGDVYAVDQYNSTIRKLTPDGTNWVVTTLAGLATGGPGSVDGIGTASRFNYPMGMALDASGNLYVADVVNDTIRMITPAGVATTLAGLAGSSGSNDGTNSIARFNQADGIAVDTNGNVYVADWGNHTIRKVTPVGTNWVVTTLAGRAGVPGFVNGPGKNAEFNYPNGVAVDTGGNVYVADTANSAIRQVTPDGAVTTVSAGFSGPTGVTVDTHGVVYVADYYSDTIAKITLVGPNWVVTTLAGLSGVQGSADGMGSSARFYYPWGVAVDSAGSLFVGDRFNNTIRKLSLVGTSWVVTTVGGVPGNAGYTDGTGSAAQFWSVNGVAVDSAGTLYVTDSANNTIRKGYPPLAITSSGPSFGFSGGQFSFQLAGPAGQLVVVEASTDLVNWLPLWTNTVAGALNFSDPQGGTHSNRFYRAYAQ